MRTLFMVNKLRRERREKKNNNKAAAATTASSEEKFDGGEIEKKKYGAAYCILSLIDTLHFYIDRMECWLKQK